MGFEDAAAATEVRLAWLASLVDSAQDAIISAGLDGHITSWNPAAERLFGYTAAEALGRPAAFLKPPELRGKAGDRVARLRRGDAVPPSEVVRRTKDGRDIEISVTHSAIKDPDGQVIGTSIVARDLTEQRRGERELAAAHQATVEASREYEAFAYAVAHDLRAPLRAIDGFVYLGREAYEGGQLDSGRSHLERVSAAAKHMGRLIDGLLRLAHLSRQPIHHSSVDLSALVDGALARLRDENPERVLIAAVEPELRVSGDGDLLDIVVTNLIENAWKFTRNRAQTRIEFGRQDRHFFLRDNGAGFDMEHYERLFGTFQRLHDQSDFEGTGIGLATTQRIIHRHGGRIWAQGAVDQGSTFSFTLGDEATPGESPDHPR